MKYLSSEVKDEIKGAPKGSVILLSAHTGSGKTTFIIGEYLRYLRMHGQRCLLVVNRISLRGQTVRSLCESLGIDSDSLLIEDQSCIHLGSIVITSYAYLSARLCDAALSSLKIGMFKAEEYDSVIFDECHYFLADALISAKSYPLFQIPKVFKGATHIYISATMKPVRQLILDMEHIEDLWDRYGKEWADISQFPCRYRRTFSDTLEFISPNWIPVNCLELSSGQTDYSYLRTRIISESCSIVEDIVTQRKLGKLDKAIVFVDSKEDGKKFKKILNDEGLTTAFICSKSSQRYMTKSDAELFDVIEETNCFEDIEVLLTTTVLDNGVSIIDPRVTHIYIAGTEYVSAVQQAGRLRIKDDCQKVELVFRRLSMKYFKEKLNLYSYKKRLLEQFKRSADSIRIQMLSDPNISGILQNLKAIDKYNRMHFSQFTDYALDYYIDDFNDSIMRLQEDQDGYVKKVLGWFGKSVEVSQDESYIRKTRLADILMRYVGIDNNNDCYKKMQEEIADYANYIGLNFSYSHTDRKIGPETLRKILNDLGFSFEGTRNKWTLRR